MDDQPTVTLTPAPAPAPTDDDATSPEHTVAALPAAAHAKRAAAVAAARGSSGTTEPAHEPSVAGASLATTSALASQQLALATMREEEYDTARTMILVGRIVGIAAGLALPLFHGTSNVLRYALGACLVFALVTGTIVERRIKSRRLLESTMVALAVSVSPAIFVSVLFFGLWSAAQLFPALSLYFFCRRERFASALSLYLLNAVSQATAVALIVTGAIDDPGLFRPTLVPPNMLVLAAALVQLGFFGAFLLGRGAHRASRDAMTKLQAAVLVAAQKDALVDEARQDLDRALALDSAGQFTGRVLGGFKLHNLIGRGGMGDVYDAIQVATGDAAAVKLLAVRELDNPQSVERFLREVAVVRRMHSPHVVRVIGASEPGAEMPFLAMERLRGKDLAAILRGAGPALAAGHAAMLTMLEQVGAAVEEAWRQGVVHRDLKPHNVFFTDAGAWKVLDFGVASLEDHDGTLTQGKVVGTPAYMAPEQARGERVDHRADVYALAAIAYRWLTGRPVCSGKDLHAALYQTVHVMPPRPTSLVALPADVDAALALGLVKDPAKRLASVAELRAALTAAMAGALEPSLRARADELLAVHAWGASAA